MSNTITAYFKGRVGVAESVYQNDYGIVMAFDSIDLPAHFDCYFSRLNQEEALPGLGADNRVTIPNSILANPGNVTIHIPLHTGEDDSEVEYVVYFKVIGRARPIDDGTPTQMTAIERALALLSQPITNIEEIVNEALSFTGDTFAEMKQELQDDFDNYTETLEGDLATWKGGVESDIDDVEHDFTVLQNQFDTAVAAVSTDTELTDIRVGDDEVTYTTAGEAVRNQFASVKSDVSALYEQTDNLIRFDDPSFWVRKDLGGTARDYAVTTSDFIPVTGGKELYTALNGLDKSVFGNSFNIHVRQFDSEDNIIVSDTTFSNINSAYPTHYALNSSTTKIKVMLTSNDWQKTFTPLQLRSMNPLIYVGFNTDIANATVYRMFVPKEDYLFDFAENVKTGFGYVNFNDFVYQSDRYIAGDGNIATDTSSQHAVLISGIEVQAGEEYEVFCESPKPYAPYLAYCAYSSSTDLRSATAIGGRVATTDIFIDSGNTFITKIDVTVPNGAKSIGVSFRTYNDAKWIILKKASNSLQNSQILNIHNVLMDAYSRAADSDRLNNVSTVKTINHRGYNDVAPENTLPAFKLSRKNGFKYVETDVQFTSDGVAVLLHDATINRTARNADGTELTEDVYIDSITYEQALEYDFGIWKSAEYEGTTIPTFEQFIALCRNIGLSAYVEIKAGNQTQIEGLVDLAISYGMNPFISWNDFDATRLGFVKGKDEAARLGLLANSVDDSIISMANALKTASNEVFLNVGVGSVTSTAVALAIANGLPIEAWTVYVNDLATLNPYVTGMTTDKDLLNNYMYKNNIN